MSAHNDKNYTGIIDIEYVIKEDYKNEDCLLLGAISKSLNASCWVRMNNDHLSKETAQSILKTLREMEMSIVYQNM